MSKIVYLDCFSGASGDMVLGALLDLGLPIDGLRAALGSLAIEYGSVSADRVLRAGVSATKFRVHEGAAATVAAGHHEHAHQHHHHDQGGTAMTITTRTITPTTTTTVTVRPTTITGRITA